MDSPQPSCEQRDHVLICRPPVLAGTLEAKLEQGKAVFTDLVIYRAQDKALLRFQLEGMISVCGDGLNPSFTVSPDVPHQIILTQVCVCARARARTRACVRRFLGFCRNVNARTNIHTLTRAYVQVMIHLCVFGALLYFTGWA